MSQPAPQQRMTPLAYADQNGCSKETVYRWIRTGVMPRGKHRAGEWGAAWDQYPNRRYVIYVDPEVHPDMPLYTTDNPAPIST